MNAKTREQAKTAIRPIACWNCRQPSTHVMTRAGSLTLHACDNCTRIDRAEAEVRGWTVAPINNPLALLGGKSA